MGINSERKEFVLMKIELFLCFKSRPPLFVFSHDFILFITILMNSLYQHFSVVFFSYLNDTQSCPFELLISASVMFVLCHFTMFSNLFIE